LGVVAPNGVGTGEFWEACLNGKSGIGKITSFDTSDFGSKIAGEIRHFDPLDHLPEKLAKKVDRFAQLGLAASQMALDDSGLDLEREARGRAGSIIGSGLGGVLFHEEQILAGYEKGAHRLSPLCVPRITPNAVAAHIAIVHGLLGPSMVISTACASGTHAIGESLRKIQTGEADIILTGGAEAPLTRFSFGAYCALRVLSKRNDAPHEASRPFDRDRDGFVLAEGAAVLVLEELGHALRRGAHIYAEIIGYGSSSGAHHIVAPAPQGRDAAATMTLALNDAGIAPWEVSYINAHGTATRANDVAETHAIKHVFGGFAPQLPISSTKSMTGHALGAAGAIEAAACCLALDYQVIPPTINYENPDPECDLDYVPNTYRIAKIDTAMSNSFGFGSVNACLLFARYPP
jgi:3-oxoacyl-[acyl-carrier-protein] synthase II